MEDYVTFEQALKLKELGFDWKVRACYRRKFILNDDNPHYTEPNEEVRLEEGELLVYFENIKYLENMDLLLARFDGIINDLIKVKTDCVNKWEFAIRFKDFDPSNMEETKKHILCVKGGRIVKYKG